VHTRLLFGTPELSAGRLPAMKYMSRCLNVGNDPMINLLPDGPEKQSGWKCLLQSLAAGPS